MLREISRRIDMLCARTLGKSSIGFCDDIETTAREAPSNVRFTPRKRTSDRLHKKSIFCTKNSPLMGLYVQSPFRLIVICKPNNSMFDCRGLRETS
jgi:hypothetical protein